MKNTKQTAQDIIDSLRRGTALEYKEYLDLELIRDLIKYLEVNYIYDNHKQK